VRRLERKVLIGLLLGIIVYAAMALIADVESVGREVRAFEWLLLVPVLALVCGNYLLRFLKWQYYLRILDIEVPARESLLVFIASFLLTVSPGKVGEVLKSFLLKRSRGVPMSKSAPIVVAERLTDLIALIGIAVVGLSTYAYGVEALVITSILVLAGLVFLSTPSLSLGLIRLIERLPGIGRLGPKLRLAYQSMRTMIRPRPLFVASVLSVAGWSLECVAFYLVVGGFPAGHPEVMAAAFLYAFTTILGAVSFLPGGLGVTDGSMSVGLVQMGMLRADSAAVTATVIIRFATLWFAVLLGLLAFIAYRRRYLVDRDDDDALLAMTRSSSTAQGPG
jgi:uncharacterized protein (TIRG00374 family)